MLEGQHKFKGLEERHVLDRQDLVRDTRSLFVQLVAHMGNQFVYLFVMGGLMVTPLVMPALTLFCFLFAAFYTFFRHIAYTRDVLPLRIPSTYKGTDYGDPIPGAKKLFEKAYYKAQGVFFLGNERNTLKELWIGIRDLLTHILVYGSTGAGKTETLVSIAFNALCMGGGFSYLDAKAAKKLGYQVYLLTRFMGRDHDFRAMNYGVSEKPPTEYHPKKVTNDNNPLNFGSAESLTQFVAATIKTSKDGNQIFGQNAQVLVTAAMYAAVELRDSGQWQFDVTKLRELLTLKKMLEVVENPSISPTARNALKQFLTSVGWQEGKPMDKQGKNLNEQFSYARAYFGLFLASLSDTYGHIYKTKFGEVDLQDVLKNRRILVIMIPSAEKTNEETENIGNINLSGLKNAMVACIGKDFEGTVEDVLDSLPIDLRVPFLSITDEHAAIQTPGYEIFMTQGRGFGIGAVVGTQDRAGLFKADEFCAQQIEGNTKVKMIGSLDDPKMTWELAKELAAETQVMQTAGYHVDKTRATSISYEDQRSTQVVQTSRVDLRDFQEQIEGQFHLFFRGRIVRGLSFYANPPLKKHYQLRINDMLPVPKPEKDLVNLKLEKTKKGTKTLGYLIQKNKSNPADLAQSLPVKNIKAVFDNPGALPPADVAVCAFKRWVKGEDAVVDNFVGELESKEIVNLKFKDETVKPPATEQTTDQQKQTKSDDPFQFAPDPDIFKKRMEANQQKALKQMQEQAGLQEPPKEAKKPAATKKAEPAADLYQGFKTIMDGTDHLLKDQKETVARIEKDWAEMERLAGATPLEAAERSQQAVDSLREASQDAYPEGSRPQKPSADAEQHMEEYMDTLLSEIEVRMR